jgi:tRNA(Ile)-lysidine synthase
MMDLERRVLCTIRQHKMVDIGEHVLVAVSGGADSMALMHCMHRLARRWHLKLTVAHLNHGIRGMEADADEQFVRESCRGLGLDFISETVQVMKLAAAEKGNLEEVARRLRYRFLRETAVRVGAGRIAVGHNLNDQAETILLRLFRGSGSCGLAGIHPVVDGLVIRPLMDCSRRSILLYLEHIGASFREDSSNTEKDRQRNRTRLELVPYLEQHFNPRLLETLSREAAIEREAAEYLTIQARNAFDTIRLQSEKVLSLPVQGLLALHPALQGLVVREALKDCRGSLRGFTARHVRDVLSLCRPGLSGHGIVLPGRLRVERRFRNLEFHTKERSCRLEYCYALPVPGRCEVKELGLAFIAIVREGKSTSTAAPSLSDGAVLNATFLPQALSVRSRRPGDRYGGNRHRKVKKMLIDAKIPVERRITLPMLALHDSVIWIPGFLPAKSFRVESPRQESIIVEIRVKKVGNSRT